MIKPITTMLLSLSLSFSASAETLTPEAPAATQMQLIPFKAEYQASYNLGWFSISISGERKLEQLANGQWLVSFEASTHGAGYKESSLFSYQDNAFQPLEYHHKTTGLLPKDTRFLRFNPATKAIDDLENNRSLASQWVDGIQDNLTYMLQAGFDLANGKTNLSYPVLKVKNLKQENFKVVGQDRLKTKVGALDTIKVEQDLGKKRLVTVWFAPSLNYQMVQLIDSEKGKTSLKIEIVKLN